MNVRIEIDTRTFVRFWLVVIGFALVAFAIYSARTALLIIGLAFFFSIALSLPVNRLVKILPSKSRVLSTAIAYVVVVVMLGVVIFLAIPPIIGQMTKFAQNIPSLLDNGTQQYAGVNQFVSHYQLQPQVDAAAMSLKSGATQFTSRIGSVLVTGIGSVLFIITAGILVFVLAFLMLVEGPSWLKRLWSIYDDQERMEYHRRLLGRMYNVVTSYITGQLSVSAIAGLVAGVAVFVISMTLSVPTDLIIPAAMIIFVLSLIPLFGEMIGNLLVGAILALNSIPAAIIFIIFFILYQQIEANYISPKIQSKRIDLSPLVILLSVTIGIYLFGIIGGIISIPTAGCIKVITEDYFARPRKKSIK